VLTRSKRLMTLGVVASLTLAACGGDDDASVETTAAPAEESADGSGLVAGSVFVSGSSTVEPINVRVAELAAELSGGALAVTVEGPGTGDGFKKFCAGEADITGEIALAPDEALTVGDVSLDPARHVVTVRGDSVSMPLKEFELLRLLLANAGRVLTRELLIDRVWGSDYVGDTKTLDVHIKRLRSKIESDPGDPTRIVTIRGLGYKFERA